jgi:hypothetical protein
MSRVMTPEQSKALATAAKRCAEIAEKYGGNLSEAFRKHREENWKRRGALCPPSISSPD